MLSIFGEEHSNENKKEISKELINRIKKNFKGSEYCEQMYNKHRKLYPSKINTTLELAKDEKLFEELLHGAVIYFKENQTYIIPDSERTIDTKDLFNFLNDTKEVFDEDTKELGRNNNGSNFLNYFIQDNLLDVVVATKSNNTTKDIIKDDIKIFNAVCKAMVFSPLLTLSRIFASIKMTNGVQVVSNFRPQSAYYLYKLGLQSMKARGDKTLYIKVPSEGWLGRLLAAHKIAYENPDITVVYDSIDPNVAVAKKFEQVCDYLQNKMPGIKKITNIKARIHIIGSESESAVFSNAYGYKYDVIGTSPPYFITEAYTEGYNITLMNLETNAEKTKKYAATETLFDITLDKEVSIGKLRVGHIIKNKDGKQYQVVSKKSTGQSRNKTSGPKAWNESFLRPTFENNYKDLHDTGILWWNIADVKKHPTFCADSCKIAIESGFELIDTYKYKLTRVPGRFNQVQDDGTVIQVDLRDAKPNYEPVYIYKKNLTK